MTSAPSKASQTDPLGHKILARKDPVMRGLIKQHGPCPVVPKPNAAPYQALVRSIIYQQLSTKAATTIFNRLLALYPAPFPTPQQILLTDPTTLRGAGVSANKQLALFDVAHKAIDGTIPTAKQIHKLSDDEIIARLTQVRGIGRWSVEMLLIFTLGRPDVWPSDDLGVRKGYSAAFGVDMPTPKQLASIGDAWRPHRTLAAWLLWRACENPLNAIHTKSQAKQGK